MNVPPPHICPSAKELSAYARDELATSISPGFDRHLTGCPACRDHYLETLGRQLLVPDVPDCRVVKEIGRGRFGVVYKAWWLTDTPRLVALKVLSSVGEMERRRFEREIAVLRHLDTPGVVRCLDAGGSGDSCYFIMDYVEGEHFDEYISAEARSLDDMLEVFEKVCRVVALAHAHGVIHRDLKPRNIIVDDRGQPHVLDFGICSVDAPDKSSWAHGTLTHPGDVIGTLRYMSPEQAWGGVAGPIDERSDVWSLGIMLYELVTRGGYPYSLEPTPDQSPHEALLERIRKQLPNLPRLHRLPRGRDLETLLERCLAWEPDERLESVDSLADDIAAYRTARRIKTRPLPLHRRVRRLAVGAATRSRWPFAACFVAAVTATLSVASLLGAISWKEPVLVTPQHTPPDAASHVPFNPREGMVVVGVFDGSVAAMTDYASRVGLKGVGQDAPTWRGLHARLMTRMVAARPRAVVWDYYFTTPRPEDDELADSILALKKIGVPVVLASGTYDDEGRPKLSEQLVRRLGDAIRHGSIDIHSQTSRPGEFVVLTRKTDGVVIPALWLATLAAVLHPEAQLEINWHHRSQPPALLYAVRPGLYLRARDELKLSRAFSLAPNDDGAATGDLIGKLRIDVGDPRDWSDRTFRYEHLLNCSDREFSEIIAGRIVLVGDLRTQTYDVQPDRHDVEFAGETLRRVPGCYLVAEAIAGLLSREYVRVPFPLPPGLLLLATAVAALGCLIPIRAALWRHLEPIRRRRFLYLTLATACSVSALMMVTLDASVGVWMSIAGFALCVPMAGSFWVEFIRNRHRVAERQRRVLEGFGFESAGTLTLPRQRLTSIPEIR